MGERGAPYDPLASVRYGQTCNCGRYCDHPDGWNEDWDYQSWIADDEYRVDDNEQIPVPELESKPLPENEPAELTTSDLATIGGFAAGAGIAVVALGIVGGPIAAVLGIGGLAGSYAFGHWLSKD